MKKLAAIIITVLLGFSFSACDALFDISDEDNDKPTTEEPAFETQKYPKEFWGEWIRMDTGDTWYIASNSINVYDRELSKDRELVAAVSLIKQSDRVTEVTEDARKYYLYASRTTTSNFCGKIASFDSVLKNISRAAGSGLGGISVIISNLNNKAETVTVNTDSEGKFAAEDVIAGDEYEITAGGQTTGVLPYANGDDIGTITVTEGVNFKTGIKPKATTVDMNRLYATQNLYTLNIEIENTGTEDCTAALYSLEFDDDLIIQPGTVSGILGTIEPGKKRIIEVTLACKEIQNEYEFKKIGITIDDPISGKSWNDSVSIKFHKVPVDFNVRSNSPVSGVIITPNANAYYFRTGNSASVRDAYLTSLTMPWSTDDYLVVISGATADTEAVYSLGINVIPDTNFTSFRDLANYESNNTETEAALVNMQNKIMSYLHKNDIDYFKINLGTIAPEFKPATITAQEIQDYAPISDKEANPGETHYLDIRIRNNTSFSLDISSATLSTTSEYITIDNGTAVIGGLNAGYYKTLTDAGPSSNGDSYDTSAWLLSSSGLSSAFRFTIDKNCPVGTLLSFTVTFTDFLGKVWTETLTIPVVAIGANIAINTPVVNNFSMKEAANGNGDDKANPRESLYLDIRVKNSGTSAVPGLYAELSTTSEYVTIDSGTAPLGNLGAGCYATLTMNDSWGGSSSATAAYLFYYLNPPDAFAFTIAENCPTGTELPFIITFTDSRGIVWTDTLTIPVE